jgi:hypothetical protein
MTEQIFSRFSGRLPLSVLRSAGALLLIVTAVACGKGDTASQLGGAQPPTPKQAIRALLSIDDVLLTVHESCTNVGAEFGDRTLGDYLAGLMAEQGNTSAAGRNTIKADCQPATTPGQWQCAVELSRQNGEDEWVRGVSFVLTPEVRVVPDSIRCTGGG